MQLLPGVTPSSSTRHRAARESASSVPGLCTVLRVEQLLAGANLPGRDEVLHAGHHHRDAPPRALTCRSPRRPCRLHDLRLDLREPAWTTTRPAPPWISTPPGRMMRSDDVADTQGETARRGPLTPALTDRLVELRLEPDARAASVRSPSPPGSRQGRAPVSSPSWRRPRRRRPRARPP